MVVGGALAALAHWFARARLLPPAPGPVAPDDTTQLLELPTEVLDQSTVVLGRRD